MTYPYIPADSSHTGGENGSVTRIVIHATCSATKKGGARNNAAYFQSKQAGGAAHYVVDPGEIIQCIHENVVGYHAPPNHGSIGIELCDPQGLTKVQANANDPKRWADADHEKMLRLAAKLVVEVAHRNGVPLVRLSTADLKAGKHGICGHVNVSQAFGQSSHSDPGPDFPWSHFMALVNSAAHAAPPAKPAPAAAHPFGSRDLARTTPPMSGADVAHLKSRLKVTTPGDVYDLDVARAVGNWQRAKGWTVTEKIDVAQQKILG